MAKDSSLDEFLGGSDESADDGDESASEPERALETADWTPGGAACASCGSVVERRWRQGEALVCGECKEW